MMKNYYDYIYLSPHLDDAALSCGGQIYQQTAVGKSVLIVTVMAGDPNVAEFSDYIQSLHERWELAADAAAARRAEDLAACQILGADAHHLDLPDCIYRYDGQSERFLYLSDADIFGDVHEAEAGLVEALTTQLARLPLRGACWPR
ncbi:MAG: PIG-L family deacetylase [Caldilineaceae bacterium]